jgi:hypothetical protein
MTGLTGRAAALLACSLMVVLVPACGSGSDPEATEGTASSSAGAPPAAAAPSDSRLPEGTYRTPELTREQLLAAGVTAGLTQAQAEQALAVDGIEQTATFALKLEGGRWTQFYSYDGGAEASTFRATYQVEDDGTVVTNEECCGETIFAYALEGDAIRLSFKNADPQQLCQGDAGCWMGFIVWESAPFSRV